jgi:predicted nucleic acid-binding Zn ribbon protein
MQSARQDVNLLARRILKDAAPDEAVALAWPLACGSAVAQRTQAVAFSDGTLRVSVPDSGWRSQLEAFSPQYAHRLSELSGQTVKRISYEVSRSLAARVRRSE